METRWPSLLRSVVSVMIFEQPVVWLNLRSSVYFSLGSEIMFNLLCTELCFRFSKTLQLCWSVCPRSACVDRWFPRRGRRQSKRALAFFTDCSYWGLFLLFLFWENHFLIKKTHYVLTIHTFIKRLEKGFMVLRCAMLISGSLKLHQQCFRRVIWTFVRLPCVFLVWLLNDELGRHADPSGGSVLARSRVSCVIWASPVWPPYLQ